MKRFWHAATLLEQDGAYIVALDGKPMRLPGGPALRLHRRALAEAVAAEWQHAGGAVGGTMSLEEVPLTRLAGTAQERITANRAAAAAALATYAEHDLLCYRVVQPEALAVKQHHAWQTWLDWAAATYGAKLELRRSIMPDPQPPEPLARLNEAVAGLDAFTLAGLGILVPAYGSLVLGLAVAAGALPALQALELSQLEELFQELQWGKDADATARRAHVATDVSAAARFMALAAA
jgi:chaperone required for assembly of F1-ATPase